MTRTKNGVSLFKLIGIQGKRCTTCNARGAHTFVTGVFDRQVTVIYFLMLTSSKNVCLITQL